MSVRPRGEPWLRYLLAAIMVGVGVRHFMIPDTFSAMMPRLLPAASHGPLVLISGAFEILGGLGLLSARSRRYAAWGLMALYVAVFPANVNMALHAEAWGIPPALLWLRLPFQGLLLAWAYRYAREEKAP